MEMPLETCYWCGETVDDELSADRFCLLDGDDAHLTCLKVVGYDESGTIATEYAAWTAMDDPSLAHLIDERLDDLESMMSIDGGEEYMRLEKKGLALLKRTSVREAILREREELS